MSATNPMDSERRHHHQLHHGGSGEVYRECLRNHAASLGSYATDGCGEFTSDVDDDSPLQCAACGCHRNFHRKVPPPPHFPALLGGYNAATVDKSSPPQSSPMDGSVLRRRSRTKFTGEQKERMTRFAEKLGWRMQRRDGEEEAAIEAFCADVGVSRQVFKVWMHNHKNSAASSSTTATPTGARNHGGSSSLTQS